jgi:hypothetical protein
MRATLVARLQAFRKAGECGTSRGNRAHANSNNVSASEHQLAKPTSQKNSNEAHAILHDRMLIKMDLMRQIHAQRDKCDIEVPGAPRRLMSQRGANLCQELQAKGRQGMHNCGRIAYKSLEAEGI